MSQDTGIPVKVLSKWHVKFRNCEDYVPGSAIGQHRRYFSVKEEEMVAYFLRVQFINPGIMIRRKQLSNLIFTLWQSMDLQKRGHLSKGKMFSRQFVKDFCRRNRLSFRKMRKKKRSDINEREVDAYLTTIAEIFASYPWDRILNMDETPWNFVFLRGEVLAETGSEEVRAQLPDDFRKQFTVVATIGVNCTKFPPLFLAHGKTARCHQQFDGMKSDSADYEIFHSSGGFSDEASMIYYLGLVHKWMNRENCALILDRYSAHEAEAVRQRAAELGIRLVYIPTSATEIYQPLDRRIFGAMKSSGSREFDEFVFANRRGYTQPEAADIFVKCWKNLSRDLINKSWNLYEELASDDTDSGDDPMSEDQPAIEEEEIGEYADDDDLLQLREERR